MQINLVVVFLMSLLTSFVSCGHLFTSKTCFPCIFKGHFRNRGDNSFDTLMAITATSDDSDSIASEYLVDLPTVRERAREAVAMATAQRLVRCRHARAADNNDGAKIKRRMAAPDLALCHFKICNMGRKRTSRFIDTVNTVHLDEN